MSDYAITQFGDDVRVRWVYDEHYETRGSYALGSDAEDAEAEEWERERLNDGRLVALGAIVEMRCQTTHTLNVFGKQFPQEAGEHWHATDSLWGIVIESDEKTLEAFAKDSLELEPR